tara:strand:- start:705 stop:1193 length:489 start_codon:yes stop_codon:yes gene_type:complete
MQPKIVMTLTFMLLLISGCTESMMFGRQVEILSVSEIEHVVPLVADDQAFSEGLKSFSEGKFDVATAYMQQAVTLTPESPQVWLALAASADQGGRFEISKPAYEQLLKLSGPVFEYQNNIGFSYILQGRYADAEVALRTALSMRPADQTVANNLALLRRIRS